MISKKLEPSKMCDFFLRAQALSFFCAIALLPLVFVALIGLLAKENEKNLDVTAKCRTSRGGYLLPRWLRFKQGK